MKDFSLQDSNQAVHVISRYLVQGRKRRIMPRMMMMMMIMMIIIIIITICEE
jgi:hypothetical protein